MWQSSGRILEPHRVILPVRSTQAGVLYVDVDVNDAFLGDAASAVL
jgi:hypothetical protein